MLDLTFFENRGRNIQTFTSTGTWQTWVKPRGAKFVDILCIGGGAGGGGGVSGLAGGSGGGSSAFTKAIFSSNVLPDILYVYAGPKGIGGTGFIGGTPVNNTLATGSISYVTVTPDTGSTSGIICRSGNLPPNVQVAGTVTTVAQMPLINLALSFNTVAGNTAGASNNVTPPNYTPTTIITPGTAGARSVSTGGGAGTIFSSGFFPQLSPGPNGRDGLTFYKPVLGFMGGTGATTPETGKGGNGSYGCGGGGGCGGSTNSGNGGDGGDGIVIITTITK